MARWRRLSNGAHGISFRRHASEQGNGTLKRIPMERLDWKPERLALTSRGASPFRASGTLGPLRKREFRWEKRIGFGGCPPGGLFLELFRLSGWFLCDFRFPSFLSHCGCLSSCGQRGLTTWGRLSWRPLPHKPGSRHANWRPVCNLIPPEPWPLCQELLALRARWSPPPYEGTLP